MFLNKYPILMTLIVFGTNVYIEEFLKFQTSWKEQILVGVLILLSNLLYTITVS